MKLSWHDAWVRYVCKLSNITLSQNGYGVLCISLLADSTERNDISLIPGTRHVHVAAFGQLIDRLGRLSRGIVQEDHQPNFTELDTQCSGRRPWVQIRRLLNYFTGQVRGE